MKRKQEFRILLFRLDVQRALRLHFSREKKADTKAKGAGLFKRVFAAELFNFLGVFPLQSESCSLKLFPVIFFGISHPCPAAPGPSISPFNICTKMGKMFPVLQMESIDRPTIFFIQHRGRGHIVRYRFSSNHQHNRLCVCLRLDDSRYIGRA